MSTNKPAITTSKAKWEVGPLAAVGVTAMGEQIYELLIANPGLSLTDLIVSSGLSRGKLQTELIALELKGLVTHSATRLRQYFPTPPDIALEALIVKQQDALQGVRLEASRLREKARGSRGTRKAEHRLVEIVTGRQAQIEVFEQIQRGARKEVISFDRPPYVIAVNTIELEVLKSGISCRGVYSRSALMQENAAKHIRIYIQAGEEARVFNAVPLKLVGADHRIAMLPLDLHYLDGPTLLVRESSLLDALYELFEVIWNRAAPISFDANGLPASGTVTTGALTDNSQLVSFLAAGLNDKIIAQQLEISPRTLDRRIKSLMNGLEARTRFQAGWIAGYGVAKSEIGDSATKGSDTGSIIS